NIPRMMFDYWADLQFDYHTIGKLFAILACVGGPGESAFGSYLITRKDNPRDFDQVRRLVKELEQEDLVRCEAESDTELAFSFVPLYSLLRSTWEDYRDKHDKEKAGGRPNPAIALVEQMLARTLSARDIKDVLHWVDDLGFSLEMVAAIINEGRRHHNTRMSYLNGIAERWAQEGIQTLAQAQADSEEFPKISAKHRQITAALGIRRPLTTTEQAMLEQWTAEWGFSTEMILAACERATGKANPMKWVHSALNGWLRDGIRTKADLERHLMEEKKREAAIASTSGAPGRTGRKPARSSNVILQRDEKDESEYDYIYKKFSK
ncbi:MAG: DnaD domain-containing protein, partial [Bacillota bacterium]